MNLRFTNFHHLRGLCTQSYAKVTWRNLTFILARKKTNVTITFVKELVIV